MKKIAILGASGSIGTNAIELIKTHKEEYSLVAFSVYSNTSKIKEILDEFKEVRIVSVRSLDEIKYLIKDYPNVEFVENDLEKIATSSCDIVLVSVVGFVGLKPTIAAIKAKKDIALANKETLVVAGSIVTKLARENNVNIYPVDSEHSAIFQCIEKNNKIRNIILTCSGGPFVNKSIDELKEVTVYDALKHPSWNMGKKITIDSATIFNKAFEVIEAKYLFNVNANQIKVLIHPGSYVHSFVEFEDGAVKAELATPDMKLPIAYAFSYPTRLNNVSSFLDLDGKKLEFRKPNEYEQKVLDIGYKVVNEEGLLGTIVNASNEEAVSLFINEKIKYLDIYNLVIKAINHFDYKKENITLDDIYDMDFKVREYIRETYNND